MRILCASWGKIVEKSSKLVENLVLTVFKKSRTVPYALD